MKKDYMARLERAARWRLPPQEAEDVIADYREIVGDPPRPEEELLRDLGGPRDAVRPLVRPKQYRIWLVVFLAMSFCILSLGFSPTAIGLRFWLLYFNGYIQDTRYYLSYVVAIVGAVTALVWFRWQGRKEARLPKAIPILLAVLLAWCGGVMLFCWMCVRDFDGFLAVLGTIEPLIGPPGRSEPASAYLLLCAMEYGSVLISLAGEVGLVKARTRDRRWAAVYILALSAMMTSLMYLSWMTNMDVDFTWTPEELFRYMLLQNAGITAAGLIGAGVALC